MRYVRRTVAIVLCGVLAAVAVLTGASRKFYDDDPVWVERDTQDASKIRKWKIDEGVDIGINLFGKPGDPTPNVRAKSVNTVDEVPDSSWFTNRIGRRPLTLDDIVRGPNATTGPAPGRWMVTSSKIDGVTPGFTIEDALHELWFLKFDPPGYRAMATGSEVVVTKLLWALGYHVPESRIVFFRPEQLVVGEGAKFQAAEGKSRAMKLSDIDRLLQRADREADGSYRVVAARGLPKIGEFRFYGTNPDDPNDIIPHEHRRELRGYRVFAAWLNHVDSHAHNTLDALIKENGRAFVRHYLQDFGSALGSGGIAPAEYWEGSEYIVEPRETGKQMIAFGFSFPKWHTTDFYQSTSIGRLPRDNTQFDPERWKPRVPIQAFLRARADDKFWAAQKLMAFTDDMLRTAVGTGQFDDPTSEAFLVRALVERRDAIGRAYLPAINPITDPALDDSGVLTFRNAAVDAGFAKPPAAYRAVWFGFHNETDETRRIGETSGPATRLPSPSELPQADEFLEIELSVAGGAMPAWERPVRAYFRRQAPGWRLVGFERMPD